MKTGHYFKAEVDILVDDGIARLTEELRMEGFGIYFALLLELRMREMYRCNVERVKTMAKRMEVEEQMLWKVIENYGLFEITEEGKELYFSSHYLNEKMMEFDKKKEALKKAGEKGAKARLAKRSKPGLNHPGIRLDNKYKYETFNPKTGERSYCGIKIPAEAPPRPNENAVYSNGQWEV